MVKYYKLASINPIDEDDEDDCNWCAHSYGTTYKTYELALVAAQRETDARKKDMQILVSVANVKYPTPSFPVEQIG